MRISRGAGSAPTLPLAPVIGAGLLFAGSLWIAPLARAADDAGPPLPVRKPVESSRELVGTPTFAELQARLDKGDQIAALHALQMALNQVGDGTTFQWKKNNRDLKGIIKPTTAFRNSYGQICRHVVYALSLGKYRKQIEFVACREAGGRWRL